MGNILKKKGWLRDTFVVSSKVFWGGDRPNQEGLSRKHVIEACHAALRRLQVDYLDLYFCHRADPNTPIEETARAMSDLRSEEHTSELQSHSDLVCRLLLEKKNTTPQPQRR